jgi:hypothetical protein
VPRAFDDIFRSQRELNRLMAGPLRDIINRQTELSRLTEGVGQVINRQGELAGLGKGIHDVINRQNELGRLTEAVTLASGLQYDLLHRVIRQFETDLWRDRLGWFQGLPSTFRWQPRPTATPNLADWSVTDLRRAHAISTAEGIPFAWVLRSEIARKLLDAPDAEARRDILLARAADVVDDIRDTIEELPASPERTHLADALATYEDGHWRSAQAHAAVIADSTVCAVEGLGRKTAVLEAQRPIGKALVREIARLLVLGPSAVIFARFLVDRGDPVPSYFNRHASSHTLDHAQWNEANALIGLMYATSIATEFLTDPPLES